MPAKLTIQIKTERRSTGYTMGPASQTQHRGVVVDEMGVVVYETAWTPNKSIARGWAKQALDRLAK